MSLASHWMTSSLCFGEMATSCWREKQTLLITGAERAEEPKRSTSTGATRYKGPSGKGPRSLLCPCSCPLPPSSPACGSAMLWCAGAERKGSDRVFCERWEPGGCTAPAEQKREGLRCCVKRKGLVFLQIMGVFLA